MEILAQNFVLLGQRRLRMARRAWEALVSDDPGTCNSVQRVMRGIIYDAIERTRVSQNIFLSDRNRQLLLDGAREEAVNHEHLKHLRIEPRAKRWFESAGLRGSGLAFLCSLAALCLLLFMPAGLVRDAVVSALAVFCVIGSAVGWIGRRRATRRIM
jgi:hypothetical protein